MMTKITLNKEEMDKMFATCEPRRWEKRLTNEIPTFRMEELKTAVGKLRNEGAPRPDKMLQIRNIAIRS